ncbi:hypothetical protein ACFLY0_01175 [Patescibacteria group bacterium]
MTLKKMLSKKNLLIFISLLILLGVMAAAEDLNHVPKNVDDINHLAEEIAEEKGIVPKTRLKTDSCTLWPETWLGSNIENECVEHDIYYWIGGTEEDRELVDQNLRESVNSIVPYLGDVMYIGVRVGGNPEIPIGHRWGYATQASEYFNTNQYGPYILNQIWRAWVEGEE